MQEEDGSRTDGTPGRCCNSVAVCQSGNGLGKPIHQDHITLAERIWLVATGEALNWSLFSSEMQVRIYGSKGFKAAQTIRRDLRAYMTQFRRDVVEAHVSCETMMSIMQRPDTKPIPGGSHKLAELYKTLYRLTIAQPYWEPTSPGQTEIRKAD